jgi:hypothetical protein
MKQENSYFCFIKWGTTAKFSKIQNMPQTIPNLLKIVEKHFSHQKNYFGLIKPCFKFFCKIQSGGGGGPGNHYGS